ncbi:MAG: hypothetical protein H7X97_00635 [Opitutaceae bacterium]|nr:hypothetical protein [Verrucomicrobiales bacterium]
MNATPLSIRREASLPTFARTGPSADVLPFQRSNSPGHWWPDIWSSTPPMPRLIQFDPTAGNDCREIENQATLTNENGGRIRQESRHTTYRVDSPLIHQTVFVTVMPAFHSFSKPKLPAASRHSTAVLHGGHLMHHFGNWIVALITCQLGSAWIIGTIAGQTLGSGRYFHTFIWVLLMMTFNLGVWFRYYGRKSQAFHIPGIGLFLAAILPVILILLLA